MAGLLALMLLTDARRPARTRADGSLVPLAEQDRSLWDAASIREGVALITETLPRARLGPYQLQAAIAAVHDEAPDAGATDWAQIVALYELLAQIAPNPMVTLNQAVAVAMVSGPGAGLDLLATLDADDRMTGHHRLPPSAPICWRWPAIWRPPGPAIDRPLDARRASRSGATSKREPRASRSRAIRPPASAGCSGSAGRGWSGRSGP